MSDDMYTFMAMNFQHKINISHMTLGVGHYLQDGDGFPMAYIDMSRFT